MTGTEAKTRPSAPAIACSAAARARDARDPVGVSAFAVPSHRIARRARRVTALLIGILVLSIADLIVTLANLHTVGMVEANPLARFMIEHFDSLGLITFKMTTVFVCLALLYRLRHSLQSEIASWLGLMILVGLSVYWGHYSRHMHHPDTVTVRMSGQIDDGWLTLAE